MDKSAVIIGAGLGGLFTGAILAKEGLKVTVLEKNPTIGGGLQSFVRFGEIFDTGMHVIGGMQEGGNIRRICEYLGIMDKVSIKDVDPDVIDTLYFAQDKKTYTIAQGKEGFVNALAKDFPDQRQNLLDYVDAVFGIAQELDLFYLRPAQSYFTVHSDSFLMPATTFIAKYITDPKLAAVLAYMNPLYSGIDNVTPAYVHALISVLYIDGPSRFAGGSHLFAEALRDVIEEHGGQVIAGDGVQHVATQDRTITSLTTRKGRTYTADYYICAIHPCTFFTLMDDPSALPKSYRNRLDMIPNSYSAFTLNIKLKPNTYRYVNHSSYYMSRYDEIWSFGSSIASEKWPMGFLYMTPPDLNQGEYANKIIVTAPMRWEDVEQWADSSLGHRPKEYEQFKQQCAQKLLDKMEEMMPGFRDCVQEVNTASPLTIRDWYGVKNGAMCGFTKDANNITLSQVPVVTKISNLLLTGQNCNLHGFCGVPLTAINTSEVILGLNYVINKINER